MWQCTSIFTVSLKVQYSVCPPCCDLFSDDHILELLGISHSSLAIRRLLKCIEVHRLIIWDILGHMFGSSINMELKHRHRAYRKEDWKRWFAFETTGYRRVMGISWEGKKTNDEILQKGCGRQLPGILVPVMRKLQYFGNLMRKTGT